MRRFIATVLLTLCTGAHAQPHIVDLVSFRPDDLAEWERFRRTSESLPLTLAELEKLAAAGVGQAAVLEMMRTRKVRIVADADTLIRLKKAGASDAVVAAVSAYALPPNDHFNLHVHVDVATPYTVGRAPFLYIEVWNQGRDRQDAFLHSDLRGLLKRGVGVEVSRDRSDPLLPETVRSLRIRGPVRTRDAGKLELVTYVTQRAGLRTLRDLPAAEQKKLHRFPIDYPGVSLDRRCRLELTIARDALIRDAYTTQRARLECRWD